MLYDVSKNDWLSSFIFDIGQTILEPFLTQFNSLHEVFLNFSYPVITYKPLRPKPSSETSVAETIKNSFDNPVSIFTVSDQTVALHGFTYYYGWKTEIDS